MIHPAETLHALCAEGRSDAARGAKPIDEVMLNGQWSDRGITSAQRVLEHPHFRRCSSGACMLRQGSWALLRVKHTSNSHKQGCTSACFGICIQGIATAAYLL